MQKMNSDKIYLVTGGTSGVGKAIAKGIAQTGAHVIIVSNHVSNCRNVVKEITTVTGNKNVSFHAADLRSMKEVFRLSESIKKEHSQLHGLINAAGAWYFKKERTQELIDASFAINYLSHFAISYFLLDVLKSTSGSRIVTVGGAPRFMKKTALDLHRLQFPGSYGMKTILSAMLARVYLGFELADRLGGSNAGSMILHPGFVKSNIGRSAPWWLKLLFSFSQEARNAPETCESGVYAATMTHPSNGTFIDEKMNVVDLRGRFSKTTGNELWLLSEQLVNGIISSL